LHLNVLSCTLIKQIAWFIAISSVVRVFIADCWGASPPHFADFYHHHHHLMMIEWVQQPPPKGLTFYVSIYVAQIVNILGSRRKRNQRQNLRRISLCLWDSSLRSLLDVVCVPISRLLIKINNLMIITFKVFNFADIQAALYSMPFLLFLHDDDC